MLSGHRRPPLPECEAGPGRAGGNRPWDRLPAIRRPTASTPCPIGRRAVRSARGDCRGPRCETLAPSDCGHRSRRRVRRAAFAPDLGRSHSPPVPCGHACCHPATRSPRRGGVVLIPSPAGRSRAARAGVPHLVVRRRGGRPRSRRWSRSCGSPARAVRVALCAARQSSPSGCYLRLGPLGRALPRPALRRPHLTVLDADWPQRGARASRARLVPAAATLAASHNAVQAGAGGCGGSRDLSPPVRSWCPLAPGTAAPPPCSIRAALRTGGTDPLTAVGRGRWPAYAGVDHSDAAASALALRDPHALGVNYSDTGPRALWSGIEQPSAYRSDGGQLPGNASRHPGTHPPGSRSARRDLVSGRCGSVGPSKPAVRPLFLHTGRFTSPSTTCVLLLVTVASLTPARRGRDLIVTSSAPSGESGGPVTYTNTATRDLGPPGLRRSDPLHPANGGITFVRRHRSAGAFGLTLPCRPTRADRRHPVWPAPHGAVPVSARRARVVGRTVDTVTWRRILLPLTGTDSAGPGPPLRRPRRPPPERIEPAAGHSSWRSSTAYPPCRN